MIKGSFKRWMNNFSTEILRFIFIVFAAAAGLAWQWVQTEYPIVQAAMPGINKEVQSLSVSLFALAMGMNIAAVLTKNMYLSKIEVLRGDIKASVPSDTRLVCRGRVEDARAHIDRLLANAKFVKNTIISVAARRGAFDNYLSESNEDISELVKKVVVDNHGRWRDIVSEIGMSRVKINIDKVGEYYRYEAKKLKYEIPIINFVYIESLQGTKEILFGFGLHDYDMHGSIFSTTDAKLIDTFNLYFESLLAHCEPIGDRNLS